MTRASVMGLDPSTYVRHPLHGEDNAWIEKNCYVDVWIEVLHALHLDPTAVMAFTLATDFEGDQWTFFKPPHRDLTELYGVVVHELDVWLPLAEHVKNHVSEGKLVMTEADAYYLADARGTDYRAQHVKTTVAIEAIDTAAQTLRYFHNAGYFALEGEDFSGVVGADPARERLPLFAEIVRIDRARPLPRRELALRSLDLLRWHLARRPTENPFARYARRFATDLEWLRPRGLALYHLYAFANLRQCGANFELAARYLRWLDESLGERSLEAAADDLDRISTTSKALVLKGARAVTSDKTTSFSPMLDEMTASWDSAMDRLVPRYTGSGGVT